MANPGRYFTNNAGKSANFFVTLHESGVDRIVFSSSSAVYGTPATVPVSEDASIQPESPYGESKAMTERVLSCLARALTSDQSACVTSTLLAPGWTDRLARIGP